MRPRSSSAGRKAPAAVDRTNPLVLSMYVAREQHSGHDLMPETRTDFYSQVTEELLIRRRARQIASPETHPIIKRQRLAILGRIAAGNMLV